MLSEEEKKIIDLLKNIDKQKCVMLECPVVKNNIERQLKIIELNRTIRQQSKEIEELKEYKHDAELTKVDCCTAQNCEALNNCIKLGRELQNADNKWKDKIKAKIEEIEKLIINDESSMTNRIVNWFIKQLQSLLEKE